MICTLYVYVCNAERSWFGLFCDRTWHARGCFYQLIKYNLWGRQNIRHTLHDMFFFTPYRFLLHLSCQSPVLEGPANFSVVETNAFKHLNHLSLRLAQGSDKEVKDYLAVCLSSLKVGSFRIPHHNTVWLLNCTTQELLYLLFYYLSGNPKKQTHRLGEEMSCNINRYANLPMENVGSTDLPESSSFSQSILSKHSFPK